MLKTVKENELTERNHENKKKKDETIKKLARDANGKLNDTKAKRKGREMTKEEEILDEVSRAALERYRKHAKEKFREKGGINKEIEDKDKEDQKKKKANESIIDTIMTSDEIEYQIYVSDFEPRIDAIVDGLKEGLKERLFDLSEKKMSCTCDDDDDKDDDDGDKKKDKDKDDDKDDKKPAFLKKKKKEEKD